VARTERPGEIKCGAVGFPVLGLRGRLTIGNADDFFRTVEGSTLISELCGVLPPLDQITLAGCHQSDNQATSRVAL
jgi:hypothetical protein